MTKKPPISVPVLRPMSVKRQTVIPKRMLLVCGAAAFGLLCGAVLFYSKKTFVCSLIAAQFDRFCACVQNAGFSVRLRGFVSRDLALLAACLLLGNSLIGEGALPVCFACVCAGLGACACFFVQQFGLNGVGFFFLCLFPGRLLQLFALLLSVHGATEKSAALKDAARGESPLSEQMCKQFWFTMAISAAGLFLASLLDCALTGLFMSLFRLSA